MKYHAPTIKELLAVREQCSDKEWLLLTHTVSFIDACTDSLERVERVASQLTGRAICTGLSQTSVDKSL